MIEILVNCRKSDSQTNHSEKLVQAGCAGVSKTYERLVNSTYVVGTLYNEWYASGVRGRLVSDLVIKHN